jgi:membrane protein
MPALMGIAKSTLRIFNEQHATRLAASVAYAFIFAIAPLFIIIIGIAGTLIDMQSAHGGHTAVENALVAQVTRAAGPDAGKAVRDMVTASFGKMSSGILAQVIGYVLFLVTASGAVGSLQGALNVIWEVSEGAGGGIWRMVRDRIAAIVIVLLLGVVLLGAFALNAVVGFGLGEATHVLPRLAASPVTAVTGAVAGIAIATLLFALIYRLLPDRPIAWADVWLGAFVTALLFALGQQAISIYLGRAGFASAYGAAGALLALLVWVYYSAAIVLFGAAFTRATAEARQPVAAPAVERGLGTQSAA